MSDHLNDSSPQGEIIYNKLISEIKAGDLLPGARLREVELAERFNSSRTPVREAIRQLEADGLVLHLPRQGATIRSLDYAEIMELYEMRQVMEGTAARLAARAASPVELAALIALNEEFAATKNEREAANLNRQFHHMMLNAAKNRYLIRSIEGLAKTMLILGPTTLMDTARMTIAAEEHRQILKAIEARDGLAAEIAMRAHMDAAQHVRLRILRPLPES